MTTQSLATAWRLWAALPPEVVALTTLENGKIGTIGRPKFPAGVCRGCGCTEHDACVVGFDTCRWRDKRRTRCSFCPVRRRPRRASRRPASRQARIRKARR